MKTENYDLLRNKHAFIIYLMRVADGLSGGCFGCIPLGCNRPNVIPGRIPFECGNPNGLPPFPHKKS